jgi:hypothetical protein
MELKAVEWSHPKTTTAYSLEHHNFEFSLRRNKGGANLETLQFGTDDNFESSPFPVNEKSVLDYFHAHEERLEALFTFTFSSDEAFEDRAKEWGEEFPEAEIFVIWADSNMIASRWVAVGFEQSDDAVEFKRRYVDPPANGEFEYKNSMSKDSS